jgi:hypothetical protein
MSDELLGPRPAYKHGGRQKSRGYDAGGAAPPSNPYEGSLLQQFNTTPQLSPVVKFVKQNLPAPSLQAQPRPAPQVKGVFPNVSRAPGSKRGGRQSPRGYDDGGIADASPIKPPILALGNGPPAPPRISDDGMAIPSPAPRANDPTVWNKQIAAQKNAALKQRIRQLEQKGK